MLGLLGALAAGLLFASIIFSKTLTEKWRIPIAFAVSGLLFLWARATIAWELPDFPSLSENSWETAIVLVGIGAALRFLDERFVRRFALPILVVVGFWVGLDYFYKYGDPYLKELVTNILVYTVLVVIGWLILRGRIPLPKITLGGKKSGGGHGGDHGH